jgi:hypothetical protein
MSTRKVLSLAALSLASLGAVGTAQASHPDVQWSVRIGLPVLPIPLPLPILLPRWHADQGPVQPAWRDRDRDGIPDWRDRHDNRIDHRGWRADADRDGIPDRYDRYDNRQDRKPDRRAPPGWRHGADRDRDGVPDWRDRRDNRH